MSSFAARRFLPASLPSEPGYRLPLHAQRATHGTLDVMPRRRGPLLLALGILTTFGPMAIDVYLPAFPRMTDYFDAAPGQLELTITTCLFGMAVGQVIIGPLSDRFGRRRPLLILISISAMASAACALAPTIEALIGLRLIQSFAGAVGIVIGRAMVRDLFSGREAARVLSIMSMVFLLAPVVAPLIGGQLIRIWDWQATFWFLALWGLVCLSVAFWVPETNPVHQRTSGGVVQALRSYAHLVRQPDYLRWIAFAGIAGAGLMGYIAAMPELIIERLGFSPQTFGFFFGANAVGMVLVTQLNTQLLRTHHPRALLRVWLTLQLVAASALTVTALTGFAGRWGILLTLWFSVISVSPVLPLALSEAMHPHPHTAGAAAALFGSSQQVVGGIAAALIGVFVFPVAMEIGVLILVCAAVGMFLTTRRLATPVTSSVS